MMYCVGTILQHQQAKNMHHQGWLYLYNVMTQAEILYQGNMGDNL